MERLIQEHGLVRGPRNEIQLGEPLRSAPARLWTILRQPVKRTGAALGR